MQSIMKEIAEAEEKENEAAKRNKQGRRRASQEKASQEIESVFTNDDHDGDYDDFVNLLVYKAFTNALTDSNVVPVAQPNTKTVWIPIEVMKQNEIEPHLNKIYIFLRKTP